MSKVVQGGSGRIKFPINEPAKGKRRSRRSRSICNFYGGPGVQHIALATDDIVETVRALRHNDVSFLRVPKAYYDTAAGARRHDRRGPATSWPSWASWWTATTRATCCRSSPSRCEDRPTLFFEIIERHGSQSFGKGNFKALFEAIEREQAIRGTL